jgi:large subunit ribosomal protein L9
MAATKILLLEDVEHVGRKGEIATVRPGYARNYLFPNQFAVVADRSALRRQAKLQEERRLKAEADRREAEEIASRLQGEVVEFEVKVDHEGHLYGSVSALDIVQQIQLRTGIELEKRFIQLKSAIKELGVFDVAIRLKEGVTTQIHVKVHPEHDM